MNTPNHGYPENMIRVDEANMRMLVIDESEGDKPNTVVLKDKYGYDDAWLAFPAKYEICGCCNGRGSIVNPSIDGNGLSEEMESDPDFMEEYMAGQYDITCNCNAGKVLVPATEDGINAVREMLEVYSCQQAEIAAERRMGYY